MRIGKIARLPVALREELNRRLDDNIPARDLLPWLNDLPEVKEILKVAFNGEPINEQNLSNWRRGGFTEWQAKENLLFKLQLLAEEADQVEALASGTADHVARLIAIHFALVLSPKAAPSPTATPPPTWVRISPPSPRNSAASATSASSPAPSPPSAAATTAPPASNSSSNKPPPAPPARPKSRAPPPHPRPTLSPRISPTRYPPPNRQSR